MNNEKNLNCMDCKYCINLDKNTGLCKLDKYGNSVTNPKRKICKDFKNK